MISEKTAKVQIEDRNYFRLGTTEIIHLISEEIEILKRLQSELNVDGDNQLSTEQKRKIRNVLVNTKLQDVFKDIEIFFRHGSSNELHGSLDYISEILKNLN